MANGYIQTPVYAWEAPYISGLKLAYGTTTTFTMASGSCTDSTASNIITVDSAVTLTSTTVGVGGLDTGTLAASTLYYVYAIGNSYSYDAQPGSEDSSSTGGVGTFVNPSPGTAVFSLTAPATGPLLPTNYDMFRYVGSVYVNSSSNFVNFVQVGNGTAREMWYDVAISALTGGSSATYASVSLANIVPASVVKVNVLATFTPTAASNALQLLPYGSSASVGYAVLSGSVAAVATEANMSLPTGLNSSVPYIQYKVAGSSTSLAIVSYSDQL